MIRKLSAASLLAAAALSSAAAAAQPAPLQLAQPVAGTRLDIVASGEVRRVPDLAIINAGVVTRAATAGQAIAQNAQQMNRVVAALKRAGVADRDIQTSSISLHPDYRYTENQPPVLTGYQASNQVTVRFRDVAESGKILDALVAEGANQINGPTLTIDKPEAALDEARAEALRIAQARAETYARALSKRVTRILSVSEGGGMVPPMPVYGEFRTVDVASQSATKIVPGEQTLSVSLAVSFELN